MGGIKNFVPVEVFPSNKTIIKIKESTKEFPENLEETFSDSRTIPFRNPFKTSAYTWRCKYYI